MGVRESIALALLVAAFALGWYSGSLSGRLGKANAAAELALDKMDSVIAQSDADRKAREKLQKTLDSLPRSQGKVNDAVTAHPSRCELDPAVAAVLHEAIRAANASRALPANP